MADLKLTSRESTEIATGDLDTKHQGQQFPFGRHDIGQHPRLVAVTPSSVLPVELNGRSQTVDDECVSLYITLLPTSSALAIVSAFGYPPARICRSISRIRSSCCRWDMCPPRMHFYSHYTSMQCIQCALHAQLQNCNMLSDLPRRHSRPNIQTATFSHFGCLARVRRAKQPIRLIHRDKRPNGGDCHLTSQNHSESQRMHRTNSAERTERTTTNTSERRRRFSPCKDTRAGMSIRFGLFVIGAR